MSDIIIKQCTLSFMHTNCYIIIDETSKYAAVVDPGAYDLNLQNLLKELNVQSLNYILLTHGHFDHIDGAKQLQSNFGGKIVIGKGDEEFLTDPQLSLYGKQIPNKSLIKKADIIVDDNDSLPFGENSISVISTPGHTKGGVCYLIKNHLFSGDTLFFESCGRTSFPTGDFGTLMQSLKKLALIEGDFNVYPGHMQTTTMEHERHHNPFIQQIL